MKTILSAAVVGSILTISGAAVGLGPTCGGFAGVSCAAGQFCDLRAGRCLTSDLQGTCRPVPRVCPRIYRPVCGCDGRTYSNDCARRAARAQKDHDGACSPR